MLRILSGLLILAYGVLTCAAAKKPLSVEEAINTSRAMTDPTGESVFVSPDGKRYVTLLIRGDVQMDGVWGELYVGSLESLDGAVPKMAARLFTRGLGTPEGFGATNDATSLTAPQQNAPIWIDNESVALLWEDEQHTNQVISVQLNSGNVKYLTHHSKGVVHFGFNSSGLLVYEGRKPYSRERSEQLLRDGFVVVSSEIDPLLSGLVDGMSGIDLGSFERFICRADGAEQKIVMHAGGINRYLTQIGATWRLGARRFSPNGRWMIVDGSPAHIPIEWDNYDSYELRRRLAEYAHNPNDWYARQLQQLFVVDLHAGQARPLWAAPILPHGLDPLELAWSPDGQSVLLGPTFLPMPTTHDQARSGKAIAIVESETNQVWQIPVPADRGAISQLRWLEPNVIEVSTKDRGSLYFAKASGGWVPQSPLVPTMSLHPAVETSVQVTLRQGPNTPPVLFAVDKVTKRERMVHDLNPRLKTFELGRVELMSWRDARGRQWKGRLFYPTRFDDDRRYPLVVQTHTVAQETEFSIYGPGGYVPGVGPGWPPFIAQPLANRGIAVLQLDKPENSRGNQGGVVGTDLWMAGVENAIEQLVKAGLVNREKVGLMGWSSSGRQVEHTLAFSDFPYAAAFVGEHADKNYFQATSYGWRGEQADWFGARAFGDGLQMWLKYSPAFNVHRIRTPVQYQGTSSSESFSSLLWSWEMFSRLRHLNKPVEYYVVPDIRHGSHTLQNPRQLVAVQNRALDWWCFWLKGEEDPDESKATQYVEWRKLRELHQVDLKEPRSPRLKWTATAADP